MKKKIAIIGGGPSGLMAADILSGNGCNVTIYERKSTFGRKFLMAGRGGLNITHSENSFDFIKKYGVNANIFKTILDNFSQKDVQDWCEKLGEKTFIGSSGRVFPRSFKASPLLRAWLVKLEKQKVIFKLNYDWHGWNQNNLVFKTNNEDIFVQADITLLSLGGASWPKLGSDGSWVKIFEKQGLETSPLLPSNCGFVVEWSDIFSKRFEGKSLKSVILSFKDRKLKGEFVITKNGVEGSSIYALSSFMREDINIKGYTELTLDLKPDLDFEEIQKRLQKPKSKLTMSNYLRKTLKLSDVAIGLLMELSGSKRLNNLTTEEIISSIKFYKLILKTTFTIDRAISTAGGVTFNSIDDNFMLINKENVFVAGEMLDWEAPTGGYLLQACLASGAYVANTIIKKFRL